MKDTYRSQHRLPWPLYLLLKESAEKNQRSLNAEIVARLQSTYPQLSVNGNSGIGEVRDTISKMSLGELMTADEITNLAERILDLAARKNNTGPTP
ncbi:Arc family DNA-binding protein [Paraburkholderia sp. CNPSo 3157]|uniref:Arc family DNA-binding protein n=1 Tax=Paraburkholderia franconis TaxID=2654983 RepID=A0A7X1NDP1_9BURK|nr:Arc family DNA-binding protein [Paraburkholderia franconis]MPW20064.1 Arc family DNA-binding protein [Paraburkholderia franconis]